VFRGGGPWCQLVAAVVGGVSWWARGVGALPRGAGWVRVAQGLKSQARGGLSERQRTKPLR